MSGPSGEKPVEISFFTNGSDRSSNGNGSRAYGAPAALFPAGFPSPISADPIPLNRLNLAAPSAPSIPPPTEEELIMIIQDLWMTVASSCHPQSAATIVDHFRADTGLQLDLISRSIGFPTTEMFLSSKFCADILLVNINKDELKEFASKTFSAISVDDITHITNLISESALSEENKEARKQYHQTAKYSTIEFQEKAIEMRERIATAAWQFTVNGYEVIPWDKIQQQFKATYGFDLTKKYLREAFPTGHPSKIIETFMTEEFEIHCNDPSTGTLLVKLRKPLHELETMYAEAKEALKLRPKVLKAPEFRSRDNHYVDYVNEREKKEIFLKEKFAKSSRP